MFSPMKFFTPAYLFELRPYTYLSTIKFLAIFFAVLVVVAIGLKIFNKVKKLEKFQIKLIDKYYLLFLVSGLLGLLITWLKYERVHILSARFWLAAWLIMVIIWLGKIAYYQFKIVPQARQQMENKKAFQKYLPGKK
jgi:hypothetical protein